MAWSSSALSLCVHTPFSLISSPHLSFFAFLSSSFWLRWKVLQLNNLLEFPLGLELHPVHLYLRPYNLPSPPWFLKSLSIPYPLCLLETQFLFSSFLLFSSFFYFFFDSILCSPGWPSTPCIVEDNLEPPEPKFWDYRLALQHQLKGHSYSSLQWRICVISDSVGFWIEFSLRGDWVERCWTLLETFFRYYGI